MAITATNESTGGGNFTPVPTGTHVMRCYRMIEIGTVKTEFKGQVKHQKKVRLEWELPNELHEFKEGEGEKPFSIGKEFTLTMYEKGNLRAFLESWRGKGFTEDEAKSFDITKLIGKECMGSIVETEKDGKKYTNLVSVSTLPKGMACPPQVNPSFVLSYDDFDIEKFRKLPEFIRKKMEGTPEFKSIGDAMQSDEHHKRMAATTADPNDDLPF